MDWGKVLSKNIIPVAIEVTEKQGNSYYTAFKDRLVATTGNLRMIFIGGHSFVTVIIKTRKNGTVVYDDTILDHEINDETIWDCFDTLFDLELKEQQNNRRAG